MDDLHRLVNQPPSADPDKGGLPERKKKAPMMTVALVQHLVEDELLHFAVLNLHQICMRMELLALVAGSLKIERCFLPTKKRF